MSGLTVEQLRGLLSYDPATGSFTWLVNRGGGARAGQVAGYVSGRPGNRYLQIYVKQRAYAAHRLAWLHMTGEWPGMDIDHKDRDTLNNAWGNLRAATVSQNVANSKLSVRNSTGFKGVSLIRTTGRYLAQIQIHGKTKHLGLYDRPEDAHAAYVVAAKRHFGEFARAA